MRLVGALIVFLLECAVSALFLLAAWLMWRGVTGENPPEWLVWFAIGTFWGAIGSSTRKEWRERTFERDILGRNSAA